MDIDDVIERMTELWNMSVEEEFTLDEEVAQSGTDQPEEPVEAVDPVTDDPVEEVSPEPEPDPAEQEIMEQETEQEVETEEVSSEPEPEQEVEVVEASTEDELEDSTVEQDDEEQAEQEELEEQPEDEEQLEQEEPEEPPEDDTLQGEPIEQVDEPEVEEQPETQPEEDTLDIEIEEQQEEPEAPESDLQTDVEEEPLSGNAQQYLRDRPLSDDDWPIQSQDEGALGHVPAEPHQRFATGGAEQEAAGPTLGPDFLAELSQMVSPQIAELKHVIGANLQDSLDREAMIMDTLTLE